MIGPTGPVSSHELSRAGGVPMAHRLLFPVAEYVWKISYWWVGNGPVAARRPSYLVSEISRGRAWQSMRESGPVMCSRSTRSGDRVKDKAVGSREYIGWDIGVAASRHRVGR